MALLNGGLGGGGWGAISLPLDVCDTQKEKHFTSPAACTPPQQPVPLRSTRSGYQQRHSCRPSALEDMCPGPRGCTPPSPPRLPQPLHPPPSPPCTWEPGLLSPDLRPWLSLLAPDLVFSPRSSDPTDGALGPSPAGLTQLSSRGPLGQSSQQTASGPLLRAGHQGPRKDRAWSVPLIGWMRQNHND